MRNLKRALSLTLASVMLLGMMVVGSSAAAGYDDVSEDDNVEAIEVLQAIEVMVGDERGFGPERPVNRAEMAVVMGKLLSLDYNYYSATCPFDDVYDWARGWVGACAANKIVSGRGDGIYDPGSTVTAVEAASMLMRALGYFQYSNDYADGFEVSTVRLGTTIGIFDNVGSSATEPMTRNQIAQMVLNALRSAVVEPDGNTINLTTPDGTVYTGKVNYVSVTSNKTFATAIGRTQATSVGSQNDGWIVELGERLYDGKLELNNNDLDDFGRPSRTWKFDGAEIGTYAKWELIVNGGIYTEEVKGRTLYELLGQTTIRDNDLDSYLNGHATEIQKTQLVRSNNSGLRDTSRSNAATTGRGVLTEVYLDNDLDKITIVSIDTYLAKATTDYNESSETITLNVYNGFSGISKVVDLEDVPGIANLKKDDWVLVNWADASANVQDKLIVNVFAPEIISDVRVTAFSRDKDEDVTNYDEVGNRVTDITADGNSYKNNRQAWYKQTTLYDYNADLMVDKTYTLYLDQYGNFIGAELYSGQDQYVFITGYDRPKSNISVNTAKASGIFTDGTMAAIDVNVKDTDSNIKAYNVRKYPAYTDANEANYDYVRWTVHNPNDDGQPQENMWYKYTLKDNVYTLSPVDNYTRDVNENAAGGEDKTINCTNVRLVVTNPNGIGTGRSYGEDASIYITVDDGDVDHLRDDAIVEVTGRYTGVQNVNLVYQPGRWAHSVYNEDGFIVAAIVYGEAEGIVDNYAYVRSGVKSERHEDDTHYWTFDAIMNGELVTKTIKSRFTSTVNTLRPGTVQELVLDADGYVTTIKDLDNGEGVNDKDEIYSNFDYNATTDWTTTLLDDYEVYDITIGSVLNPTQQIIGSPIGDGSGRYMIDMSCSGHTLHYDRDNTDIGLDFVNGAKAIVHQIVNNKDVWTDGIDVHTAFNMLVDADHNTNNNTNGVKQFSGRVVAVLNAQGVAEWVFFDDFTPRNSSDPNYNQPTVNGERISQYSTLTRVNELLQKGDVVIDGTWNPNDVSATNNILYIPANRTLTILGDFDAWKTGAATERITVAADSQTTSKLVVGDAASAPNARLTLVQDVNFPVEARNMTIGGATATFSQPVSVANNLTVNTTLTANSTLTVGGTMNGSGSIDVRGTVTVGTLSISAGVHSISSLIVKVAVTSGVTVTVGDGASYTLNGYVDIKTLNSGATLLMKNVAGGNIKTSTVGEVQNSAIVNISTGASALTVTGKLDTPKVAVAAGATLTIKAGAELGANSKFELAESNTAIEGNVSSDLVIRPAANVGSTDGSTAIPVPETTTSVPVKSPTVGQPTSIATAETISNDMKALAPYITLNLSETYTPNSNYDASPEEGQTDVKGTIALSGSVSKVDGAGMSPDAMGAFADENNKNWAVEGDGTSFSKLYDLVGKNFGFVVVKIDTDPKQIMVVQNNGRYQILRRNASDGALTYYDKLTYTINGVKYDIDVTGLR
ncbi:S-layer homology domain-containing protein [Oscillospiraceae bacterium 44-5]